MELSFVVNKKAALLDKDEIKTLFSKIKCNLNLLKSFVDEALQNKNLFVSFNGGKDCTATLVIVKYYLYCNVKGYDYTQESSFLDFIENQSKHSIDNESVKLVYFIRNDTFQEEIDFCFSVAKKENVKLILLQSNYKTGLQYLKDTLKLETVFMGIRKDDFSSDRNVSERDIIQQSDSNYPSFYRLYPVFQFTYREIWILILQSKYDYLCLYDAGFTSIGSKSKTFRNKELELSEYLKKHEECMSDTDKQQIMSLLNLQSNSTIHLPAFVLDQFETERGYRS